MQRAYEVAQLVEALHGGRSASIPDGVIGFLLTQSFRSHCGPGLDSASKRNEYQKYLLWGKGGRCVGLITLLPSCTDRLRNLGSHNSLDGALGARLSLCRDSFTFYLHRNLNGSQVSNSSWVILHKL